MGIDTGSYETYRITKEKEVIFKRSYDEIEKTNFKYPNGELYELSETLSNCDETINLGRFLIWDRDDRDDANNLIIQQLENFSFKDALSEGLKAKEYIKNNYEKVKEQYGYIDDPLEVLNYLLYFWEKGYYINWGF